jgi:hypothetical protein
MAERAFKNFADLYRAAFAEPNAERKVLLLSQVKQALDDWAQASGARPPVSASDSSVSSYNQAG